MQESRSKQHKPKQRKVYGGTCFQFRTLSKTGEYMKLWEHVWTCRSVWWQRWSIICWCRIWKVGKAWKSRSFCNWESKYNRYCIRHFLNRRKHTALSTNRDYPWNGSGIQTLWTRRAVWEPGEWLPNLMVCSSNYLSVMCDSFNAFEGKLDLCYQTETPNQEPNSAIPCHWAACPFLAVHLWLAQNRPLRKFIHILSHSLYCVQSRIQDWSSFFCGSDAPQQFHLRCPAGHLHVQQVWISSRCSN